MPPARAPIVDFAALPHMLTIDDIAALYRVSAATIRRACQHNRFDTFPPPYSRTPYRWLKSEVDKFLRLRQAGAGADRGRRSKNRMATARLTDDGRRPEQPR